MYFNFTVYNPFCKKSYFKNLFFKFKESPFQNKGLEFELIKYTSVLFKFELKIIFEGHDHAGPEFSIGAFGYEVVARAYDYRHWDYQNNRWEKQV
jgi:hypothetical protein